MSGAGGALDSVAAVKDESGPGPGPGSELGFGSGPGPGSELGFGYADEASGLGPGPGPGGTGELVAGRTFPEESRGTFVGRM